MVATTNWRPVSFCKASSFCSSWALVAGSILPAASTTRPSNLGKVCAITGTAQRISQSPRTGRSNRVNRVMRMRSATEIHLRGILGPRRRRLIGSDRLGTVEDLRTDRIGEGADTRVIGLNRRVIIADRDVDAVLGTFELAHESLEIVLALQVRIGLDIGEQAAERAAELPLCLSELLHLGRIRNVIGADLDRGRLGAGVDHVGQDRLFRGGS